MIGRGKGLAKYKKRDNWGRSSVSLDHVMVGSPIPGAVSISVINTFRAQSLPHHPPLLILSFALLSSPVPVPFLSFFAKLALKGKKWR